jgi:hypothetical protein
MRGARLLLVCILIAASAGCSVTVNPAAIADAQTAARVKTALVNDPEIGGFTIEVQVVSGIASLSGRVRTQAQADRAVNLATSADGVVSVTSNLQVGADAPVAPPAESRRRSEEWSEIETEPSLLALGAALGSSIPGSQSLKTRVSVSPLIRLGSPSDLGPAVAFDWIAADLETISGRLTRVHMKPVMAGVGYALVADRFSLTPSIVAGYSFNSLTVTGTGSAAGLPVEVANSLAWRVGATAWFDLNRRIAAHVSSGYLMTRLRFTVLDGERLVRQKGRGDTTILHFGLAYRLF